MIELDNNVAANQGFRITGWFKPAMDEEGVASGTFAYHISSIESVLPFCAAQNALMNGHVGNV